jgi:hypothetical protein
MVAGAPRDAPRASGCNSSGLRMTMAVAALCARFTELAEDRAFAHEPNPESAKYPISLSFKPNRRLS